MDDVERLVYDLTPAIEPFGSDHLTHGDLTFENMLWDGSDLRAILDFEWSRTAPANVDLDVLLRMCCYPFLHVGPSGSAEPAPRTTPIFRGGCERITWNCSHLPARSTASACTASLTTYAISRCSRHKRRPTS